MDSKQEHHCPNQYEKTHRHNHGQLNLPEFEVCITSYKISLIEKSTFKQSSFEYIIIDVHHIKMYSLEDHLVLHLLLVFVH